MYRVRRRTSSSLQRAMDQADRWDIELGIPGADDSGHVSGRSWRGSATTWRVVTSSPSVGSSGRSAAICGAGPGRDGRRTAAPRSLAEPPLKRTQHGHPGRSEGGVVARATHPTGCLSVGEQT